MTNTVYVAASLDGYIADRNNEIGWLNDIPQPEDASLGFTQLMDKVDAMVMGRNTFEMVASFDVPWPYSIPVFVASDSLQSLPEGYEGKASLIRGGPQEIVRILSEQGFDNLYIDGGRLIHAFLAADLIDELIITTIPILLGGGRSLFGELCAPLLFTHVSTERFSDQLVQNSFVRVR